MIRTGRQITGDVSLTCDVVIVGSGAGGGVPPQQPAVRRGGTKRGV